MKIFAHRGASHDAPENTLAAFRLGWQQGADGAELDVRLSADGKIIVCHDADTLRTTGQKLTIAKTGSAELRMLDAGTKKNQLFAGERLPMLQEVIEQMPLGRELLVEVKCGEEIIPALLGMKLPEAAVAFLSFDEDVLRETKREMPEHRCLLNVEPPHMAKAYGWIEMVEACATWSFDGVSLGWHNSIDRELVDSIHGADLLLAIWTVDDPDVAVRAWQLGVDILMTNRPGEIIAELRRRDGSASP